MDGFEAHAQIRGLEAERGTRTPIVALTAHSMRRDQDRCIEAGFDGYLSKPIRRDELHATTGSLRGRPAAAAPGFDRAYALAQAGGDASLLDELAALFQVHGPRQLDALRDALRRGAARDVALAAHTLKGSATVFLPQESLDALHRVEQFGKQGRLADALALLPPVEAVVGDLAAALESLGGCERVAIASV
jgi:CheY-like chemotaxis protein